MIFLGLGLLMLTWSQLSIADAPALRRQMLPVGDKDWIRKEVGAIIKMTLEFIKDMDMKMRDVRRVEKYYYGLFDFGAGRLFTTIQNKFDHMVLLYKNTSRISRIMQENVDLRSQIVGMLQFMLSDYMEFLSLIDLFKERYSYWKASSAFSQIKDKIEKYLVRREVYPTNYFNLSCVIDQQDRNSRPTPLQRGVILGDIISPKWFTAALEDVYKILDWRRLGININVFPWIIVICVQNNLAAAQATANSYNSTNVTTTTTTTQKTLDQVFREIRKNQTTKDADMIIKMTRDFIMDMHQKMKIVKRVELTYSGSAAFSTGSVFSDITKKFRHMCELYKEYATVRRYIFEEGLNQTMSPSPDVIIIFQIMLGDYNEILMQIELFKIEMLSWTQSADTFKSRDLIRKQMLKFGSLPSGFTPPRLIDDVTVIGNEKEKQDKVPRRNWDSGRGSDYQQKWSGELEGIGFDDR